MDIEYREINPHSFEEVKYFFMTHEYSWRDSDPDGFIARTNEKRNEVATEFMEKLKQPAEKYHCLGAFFQSKLIGSHFLDRYKIDGKSACHVHGLWVDQEFRGSGIALRLKEMGEAWARSKGCELMDSNVRVTNEGMIALNNKMGYTVARYNFRKNL